MSTTTTSNQSPVTVGVWLSVKKWTEMKSKGLFDPTNIMSAKELLSEYIFTPINQDSNNNNDADICPVEYFQLELPHASALSQQQDSKNTVAITDDNNDGNEVKNVETAPLHKFEVLLHKNSETMANSIFFQIQDSILEYSLLLQQIELQIEQLKKENKELILVDEFANVEKTLDRCAIYNHLMNFFPVGEYTPTTNNNNNNDDNKNNEPTKYPNTPLPISLPPSVLLYQPLNSTVSYNDAAQMANNDLFDIATVQNSKKTFQQKPLLPCNALTPKQVAQYPLFFDHHGDGLIHSLSPNPDKNNTEKNNQILHPSILCLKSPLSSGSSVSHAMVLSHNAISSGSILPDLNQQQQQFKPPTILYTLPPGLHLLTHVSPHHKVYKVYVIGDIVEVECRDSIDINGIYKKDYLSYQAKQFKQLCSFAMEVFKNEQALKKNGGISGDNNNNNNQGKTMADLKQFSQKLQEEFKQYQHDQEKQPFNPNNNDEPVALYFNSQYMKMHMYTGSTPVDLLQNSNDTSAEPLSHDTIDKYLQQVLDGSVQPLLSLFPNPRTLDNNDNNNIEQNPSFTTEQLYPSIQTLYPSSTPSNPAPIQDNIQLSQRTVIPPYLPGQNTFEHATSESFVTSSLAWKDHVSVRKILKSLWTVDDHDDFCHHNDQYGPQKHPLINLNDNDDINTIEFKETIRIAARILQDNVGLSLFGFDVVQNYYTKALTIIDVNYFPAYTAVKNFPTRVALEVLKRKKAQMAQKKD